MSRPRADTMPVVAGSAEAERIADGNDPVADPRSIRVTEPSVRERLVRFDFENREIRFGVGAYELRLEPGTVIERDGDLGRVLDDVVVGDDIAFSVDDETGTHALKRRRGAVDVIALTLEETSQEILEVVRSGRSRLHRM